MYKWLFLILCVAVRPCLSVFQLNYTSLGCWKDTAVRAVPSKEGDPILGSSNYTQRANAIQQCAQVAFNHSFQVFVVQNGGWCGTSANASSTYNKYGPSTLCAADGKGGTLANNVYQLSSLVSAWTRYNNFEYATSVAQNYKYKEAKTICNLFNATIALPKTAGVRTFLQTLNYTSPIRNWIGLQNDSSTADNFRWEDGSPLLKSETNYGSLEPSSPANAKMICMLVDQQLLWYVRRCSQIRGYICQRPAAPFTSTTPLATTVPASTTTTTSAPAILVFCNGTSIKVSNQNTSYTFPRTKVGFTSVSHEKCPNGNPIASADCMIDSNQSSKGLFAIPHTINCNATLSAILSQNNIASQTTASVQDTMATLKLLTSNTSIMTSTNIAEATAILSSLSQTNVQTVNITTNTMYDALITANQISDSYRQVSNFTASKNTKVDLAEKQKVVKAITSFADRVILPPSTTSIQFVTAETTVQVTEPIKTNAKYESVTFGSTEAAAALQPVAVLIPGALFDEASNLIQPRVKRSATTSSSPVRASIIAHNNSTLFPAAQKPPAVLSVQIRGYQPSTTTTGIQLNFTNTKAKQGSVPFNNGSLKEKVTRTQCNVYQASDGSWHPNGCTLVTGSSPPTCVCYKLASFSMIVSTEVFLSSFAQGIVSYVGCSLSVLGLLITICIYLIVKELRTRQPTRFLLNICFNLLLVNLIFMFGVADVENKANCYASAAFMHFFLLATWFWMSANAHNMYKALTEMMIVPKKSLIIPMIICYGLPCIMVLLNSTITIFYVDKHNHYPGDPFFHSSYRARSNCWIHGYSLQFGFLLPVGILALFNLACFITVMIKITCKKNEIHSTANKRNKKEDFIIAISVCVVMGLTWLFGFLMMVSDNVDYQTVMSWLFTIFNSTQGLFIFLMNCVRQKKVRDMWWIPVVACITCKKRKPRNHGSSALHSSKAHFASKL